MEYRSGSLRVSNRKRRRITGLSGNCIRDNYSRTTGGNSNVGPHLSATDRGKPSQDLPLESLLVHSNVRLERMPQRAQQKPSFLFMLLGWSSILNASVMIWPICQYTFARPAMSCSRA
jgi:hypothetical protein